MKLNKKINALLLGLGMLLAACGKDKAHQEDPAPENQGQATCQIIEMSTPAGTSDFIYNSSCNLKQISSQRSGTGKITFTRIGNKEVLKSTDANNRLIFQEITIFDNNNLPEIHKNTNYFPTGDSTSTASKFFYNAAGQLEKAVMYLNKDTVENSYGLFTYPAADQVIVTSYTRNANGSFTLSSTWHGYFDTMKNPYLHVGVFRHELLYSKNNILRVVLTDHKTNTVTTSAFSYVYNAEGYPTTQNSTNNSGQGPAVVVGWKYSCQ